MKHLFILRNPNENYQISSLVKYNFMLFEKKEIQSWFINNDIKIITIKNPILSQHIIDDKFDLSSFKKYILEYSLNNNVIILAIGPDFFKIAEMIKNKKNIIICGWQDDPHYFANFAVPKIKNIYTYSKNYDSSLLNKLSFLITPSSIYFKNLNMDQYYDKIIQIFYTLNEDWYPIIDSYISFKDRREKILLSGSINYLYKSRTEQYELSKNTDIINVLKYPCSLQEEKFLGLNYYKKLCKFKGAFASSPNKPINYIVAKHIEILMCGCIGFFDESDLLKDMGLIAYKHYVPCTINNELIEDPGFYKKYINTELGENIARNGRDFVRKKFGNKNINKYIDFFKSLSFTV